ncbi:MAG: TonB family protein [Proteobacteria bacterium]|nr:TonB family protein [Pseudomonadota bacterium]
MPAAVVPEVQNVAPVASSVPKIPSVQKEADNAGKTVDKAPPVMPMPERKPAPPPPPVLAYQKPSDITKRFSNAKPAATEDVSNGIQQFGATDAKAKTDVSGSKLGNATHAQQLEINSYEEQLALWLQRHQVYPLSARRDGLEGRAILRLQMDRMGNVRFMELSEKTGYPILDSAILSMVQRAEPLPPVPENYPESGYILEFLLPVSFTLTEADKKAAQQESAPQ